MNNNHRIDWLVLSTAENEALAQLTAERLTAAGIPVVLEPGDAVSYLGASSPYMIKVPEDRLADAQELLND